MPDVSDSMIVERSPRGAPGEPGGMGNSGKEDQELYLSKRKV